MVLVIVAVLVAALAGFAYWEWQAMRSPMAPDLQTASTTAMTEAEVQARLAALAGSTTPPTAAEVQAQLKKLSGKAATTTSGADIQARVQSLQ